MVNDRVNAALLASVFGVSEPTIGGTWRNFQRRESFAVSVAEKADVGKW